MSVVIDPAFSVFDLVRRVRQNSIIMNHRRTMALICKKIEERLLREHVKGDLFAGFQKTSFFLRREVMYAELAQRLDHIYVFAYPDVPFPNHQKITFIPLKQEDHLLNEWFLIFHSLSYVTALVGDETGAPSPDGRIFEAMWTFDLPMVKIMTEWLISALDAKLVLPPDSDYHHVTHDQLKAKSISDLLASPVDSLIQAEIQQTITAIHAN